MRVEERDSMSKSFPISSDGEELRRREGLDWEDEQRDPLEEGRSSTRRGGGSLGAEVSSGLSRQESWNGEGTVAEGSAGRRWARSSS